MFGAIFEKLINPAINLFNKIRTKTHNSTIWRISTFLGIAGLVTLAIHTASSFVIYKSFEETDEFVNELNYTSKINITKTNIDYTTSCIESTEHGEKLSSWYCNRALVFYQNRPTMTSKEEKDEIISRQSFRTIRDELNKEVRFLETQKPIESKNREYTKTLKTISNPYIYWLLSISTFPLLICIYWLLKTPPSNHTANNQS